MGYTKNALSGFGWQTVLKLFQSGLTLLKISILARILSPDDFGMFSLVTIALGAMEAFTQTGVNFTLLQSKRPITYFLDTAWVIAIVRGFCIAIFMILLGMVMGTLYQKPDLPLYISFAALIPIIKGFINPAIILLHKKLDFFKDSLYRLSLTVADVILAILFGLLLKSFTALILAMIGAAVFEVVISFAFFVLKPKFAYFHSRAKTIYENAKWLSLSAILSYAHENLDNFILGKTIGTYNLGLYHNAYSIGHKTNYDLSRSALHSTLPIYTKIADDTDRLRRAFSRSSLGLLGLTVLATAPIILFPRPVVSLLLGSQWLSVADYLPAIAFAGLLQMVAMQTSTLLMATKKFAYTNAYLVSTVILLAPLIYFWSSANGIAGAALALIVSRAVPLPILFWGVFSVLRKEQ